MKIEHVCTEDSILDKDWFRKMPLMFLSAIIPSHLLVYAAVTFSAQNILASQLMDRGKESRNHHRASRCPSIEWSWKQSCIIQLRTSH